MIHPRKKSYQLKTTLASFAMFSAAALMAASPVTAATIYYDGGTNTWVNTSFSTDPANPTPDPAAAPGIGDDIIFNRSGNNAVANVLSLGGNQAANSLTFSNTGTNGIIGSAAGQTLTLGVGGITINGGAGAVTIGSGTAINAAGILLNASQAWTNNAATTFSVLNTITNVGNVAPFTLTLGGTGATILSGVISNGGTTGTTSLVKNDAGALTLSGTGTNTFSGGVTLNAGTLNLGNATALGTGTFNINGGTINTNGAALALTTNNAINVNANFTFTGTNSLNLGAGAVTLVNGTRTITASALTLTIGGNIGDGGAIAGLTKAGNGTLVLSGTNTYGGVTTVTTGTLQVNSAASLSGIGVVGRVTVGAAGALAVSAGGAGQFTSSDVTSALSGTTFAANSRFVIDTTGGNFTYTGAVASTTGNNAFGLTKSGNNTLTLTSASAYTANTFISLGTLSVSNDNQLGTGTAGISFNGGGGQGTTVDGTTLLITGANTFVTSRTFSQANNRNFIVDVAPGSEGTINSAFSGGASAGIGFGYQTPVGGTPNGIINLNGAITINDNGQDSSFRGERFRNITANITAANTAGGAGPNTTDIIVLGLGPSETTVVNVNGANGRLVATNSLDITMGGTSGSGGGGSASTASTTTLNLNGTNTAEVSARNLYVGRNGFTTATVNHNSGGVALATSLVLGSSGANTAGTYNLGNGANSTAILTTPIVTKGIAAASGTLNFNGGTLTAPAATTTFLGTGTTAVTATVDVGGAKINTGAFAVGVTQGLTHLASLGATADGGLTKTIGGTGTLTLNGVNTFTGPTTINAGTLQIGATNGLATTSGITVANTAILSLAANDALRSGTTVAPVILSGGTLRNSGAVSQGNGSTVGIGMLTLTTTSTLDFGTTGSGTLTFSAFTVGAGSFLNILNDNNATGLTAPDTTVDHLIFNQDQSGNLANFQFNSVPLSAGQISLGGGFYEIVPVPEPSTWAAGLFMIVLAGWHFGIRRRRPVAC